MPIDPLDVTRAQPAPSAGAARDRVGRGHEGVGAVIEVEERGLGPFEEDLAAGVQRVVDHADGVAHHRLDPGGVLAQVAVGDVLGVEGKAVVHLGQDGVLLLEDDVELLAEDLRVEEVLDPQADPGRLVGVGRADPALGRPSAFLPRKRSVTRSSSWWYGMIRCALPLTTRRLVSMPLEASASSSSRRTAGSTTTPLPMIGVMWS